MLTEGRENGPSGITSSGNYVLSTLSLSSARVEHGGRYECRATNAHGNAVHGARLNVYGKKYIIWYFLMSLCYAQSNIKPELVSKRCLATSVAVSVEIPLRSNATNCSVLKILIHDCVKLQNYYLNEQQLKRYESMIKWLFSPQLE